MVCRAEEMNKFFHSDKDDFFNSHENNKVLEDLWTDMFINESKKFNYEALHSLAQGLESEDYDIRTKEKIVLAWVRENKPLVYDALPEKVQNMAFKFKTESPMNELWNKVNII